MTKPLKPLLRFNSYNEDWEQRKLGDMMNVTSVKRIHQSDWTDSGIRFLRARDIVAAYKNEEPTDYLFISKEKYDEYSAISGKVKKGDLLVTGVGTIGVPMLINDEKPLYFKDGNIIWFQNGEKINGEFFYYSFIGKSVQYYIQESAGTGTVGTYTIDSGKKTPILIPTESKEQEQIGAFFTYLDNLITLHQRKLETLKVVKKSMLEKMFPREGCKVPEIRFFGFTEDWEQRKLGEVGTTFTGLSGKTASDFGHGEASFITYMNVFSNAVSDPTMVEHVEIDSKQREVEVGDVFFTTSSETPEEVGMSSVLKEKCGVTYLNSFCFGFRPTEKFDLDYLAFMLRSESVRSQITLLAQGISRFNISKTKMMDIYIQVPRIDEQIAIGKYFSQLDNLITLHQRELELLQNVKKSLLEKMFV